MGHGVRSAVFLWSRLAVNSCNDNEVRGIVSETGDMNYGESIYCGSDAVDELVAYWQGRQLGWGLLVADENTYAALGERVAAAMRAAGCDLRTVILSGDEVHADERRIVEVMEALRGEKSTLLAVGSGTITDTVRFVAFSSRNRFVSLPTAPSMDGYTSAGAALILRGRKVTLPARPPVAVFADLPTLSDAPQRLIGAGFADVLGKYVSLADWRLAALLFDEGFDDAICRRAYRALEDCMAQGAKIGRAEVDGIETLFRSLLESGRCMADLGNSRPASGSEHMYSHYWEMRGLEEGWPVLLHGDKVGIGTILAARRYEALRSLPEEDVAARLDRSAPPDREAELAHIRAGYGHAAGEVADSYSQFIDRLAGAWDSLRHDIGARWDAVLEIAADVPPAGEIERLLRLAGAPSTPEELCLCGNDVEHALRFARYVRNRFTVDTVGQVLGLW